MNTRRAWATSGRSPACAGAGSARPRAGSFFERHVVGTQKPMHRTQPDGDPARDRKRAADLLQGQVGLPGNQLQHLRAVLAQPAATVAAHRARARMALGPPALPPSAMKPITRCLRSCEYGAGISPPMAWSSCSLDNQHRLVPAHPDYRPPQRRIFSVPHSAVGRLVHHVFSAKPYTMRLWTMAILSNAP